mgnify:FL=1
MCSPPLGAHSTCAVDLCEARDFAGVGLVFIMVPSCRPASRRTTPATGHRHGTLNDFTLAVHADAPPAGIRIRGAGFWHGVGNLSGALLLTKTCIPDEQHEQGGQRGHACRTYVRRRNRKPLRVESGLVRKRPKPENNPNKRDPCSNDHM